MKRNQRVVKSIPDHQGNNYTKTDNGGRSRMQAAANYMDQRELTQLYKYEDGLAIPTDRYEAGINIENSETRYQQHMVFTTKLKSSNTYVSESEAIKSVAKSIQDRRPDAEIYALALHSDGKNDEEGIHVHVIFGSKTTLRRDDLRHFREESYKLEETIEIENQRDISKEDLEWIQERLAHKKREREGKEKENEQA